MVSPTPGSWILRPASEGVLRTKEGGTQNDEANLTNRMIDFQTLNRYYMPRIPNVQFSCVYD